MGCEIVHAESAESIGAARALFREYAASLGFDLAFQDFDRELASLPGGYAPPEGCLLLARCGGRPAGCVGLRKLADGVCEMKRLYVCPEGRGLGIGKQIAMRLIHEGIRLGYSTMVLDTLNRLEAAIHLYESLGFVRTDPYYDNPLPDVVYWKLDLGEGQG